MHSAHVQIQSSISVYLWALPLILGMCLLWCWGIFSEPQIKPVKEQANKSIQLSVKTQIGLAGMILSLMVVIAFALYGILNVIQASIRLRIYDSVSIIQPALFLVDLLVFQGATRIRVFISFQNKQHRLDSSQSSPYLTSGSRFSIVLHCSTHQNKQLG